jgi:hypothetical protein
LFTDDQELRANPHVFCEERSEVASQIRAMTSKMHNHKPVPAVAEAPVLIGRHSVSHEVRYIEGSWQTICERTDQCHGR